MKHDYEERKKSRISKARELATKNLEKSKNLFVKAEQLAALMPPGQPILVGHHSEQAHRNHIKKIDNSMRRAFEAEDKADYYDHKASHIENSAAVSSDDPQAICTLEKQLAGMMRNHQFMKSANTCLRNNDKEGFMKLPLATETTWLEITTSQFGSRRFNLAGNSANMRRVKQRIAELKKMGEIQTSETVINGVRLVKNAKANRIQLFFPERVSKERYSELRKLGFVWCRSEGAFQRQLKSYAISRATEFLNHML